MKSDRIKKLLRYAVPFMVIMLMLTLISCSVARDFKEGFERGLKEEVIEEEVIEEPVEEPVEETEPEPEEGEVVVKLQEELAQETTEESPIKEPEEKPAEEAVDEPKAEEIDVETATETTTGVITASSDQAAFKDAWKKIIEDDGSNKVTKITFSDDGLTFYLNYNNTGDSPDAVKIQMYVFLTIIAMNNSNLNVALNGTWRMTTTYHSYTSTENMVRIKNSDLSYGDWLKIAIE